ETWKECWCGLRRGRCRSGFRRDEMVLGSVRSRVCLGEVRSEAGRLSPKRVPGLSADQDARPAAETVSPRTGLRRSVQGEGGGEFIVAPDVVAAGLDSLRLTEAWLPRLEGVGQRRLVAVQDGMAVGDVRGLLGPAVGVFVGGTVPWKLATMRAWGRLARERGA